MLLHTYLYIFFDVYFSLLFYSRCYNCVYREYEWKGKNAKMIIFSADRKGHHELKYIKQIPDTRK